MRVVLHAMDVAVRDAVLGVDRRRQRLDRGQIELVQLVEMPGGLLDLAEVQPHGRVADGADDQDQHE